MQGSGEMASILNKLKRLTHYFARNFFPGKLQIYHWVCSSEL